MAKTSSKDVLLAQEHGDFHERLADLLRRDGYGVTVAPNGHEATQAILRIPFDAILADLSLPDLDGPAFLRAVRRVSGTTLVVLVRKPFDAGKRVEGELPPPGPFLVTDSRDPVELARLLLHSSDAPPRGGTPPPSQAHSTPAEPLRSSGSSEKRRSPRVQLQEVVHYQSPKEFYTAYLLNLSESGMFIETTKPLPAGTRLTIKFTLPGTKQCLLIPGHVARVEKTSGRRHHGMGVRFDSIDEATREAIRGFVVGGGAHWSQESPRRAGEVDCAAAHPAGARKTDVLPTSPAVPGEAGAVLTPSPAVSPVDVPEWALSGPMLRLSFESPEAFLAEYDADIRLGALFVPAEERFERRTKVTVEIRLPGQPDPVRVRAEVVACLSSEPSRSRTAGIALQLDPSFPRGLLRLQQLANRLKADRQK